jgi:putative lysine transport system substrate-binding protein
MDRLQSGSFFIFPTGGENQPESTGTQKGNIMRRITAIVLAMLLMLSLGSAAFADGVASGVEDGVLTIAMECAYAPYNWTQSDDSNGAVPIANVPGSYANGYDVMIGKKICEANGWQLEVIQSDWDSLVPGVQTGTFDAVIAGQSMTSERAEQVDFAGPYFYATIVCLTKADSPYANAAGLADLAGGSCTAQIATIWYDTCLPQITGANVLPAAETAPAMLMALETGMVDFVCTDMPTAQGAVAAYPDMVILDFSGTDGDFQFTEQERAENVNIGVSMMKGNTVLHDAIDSVLSQMSTDDFNQLMAHAIEIQPLSED